jgi:hypothetical protein
MSDDTTSRTAKPERVPNADALFPLEYEKTSGPQTFELGLVLGGTVSAGAYTAGALDYLLQSLDAWYNPGPGESVLHDVTIRITAGASGGAVCGAMLAIAANRKITPIKDPANVSAGNNPFWDIWVDQLDIAGLTTASDLAGDNPPLTSLLNSDVLDEGAEKLVAFANTAPNVKRPYLEDPFRLVVTLSNLRGVPYRMEANGWADSPGSCVVAHNDFARLVSSSNPTMEKFVRPDEFWVVPSGDPGSDPSRIDWKQFARFALASGAFPIGLKARELVRPPQHYLYRPFPDFDTQTKQTVLRWLDPAWELLLPPDGTIPPYTFTTVDGGMFNNDPISLTRTWLAGLAAHNPRDAKSADRAVFLVDPLASQHDNNSCKDNLKNDDLFGILMPLITGGIGGARYLTSDLLLMSDPGIFSRFQLVPMRKNPSGPDSKPVVGDEAIIGSRLGAFAGFFSKEFRVHDFMLGRVNMQSYLRRVFVLHKSNPLFQHWRLGDMVRWAVTRDGQPQPNIGDDDCYLPIIPERGFAVGLDMDEGIPWDKVPWPTTPLDMDTAKGLIESRLLKVIQRARQIEVPGVKGWLFGLLADNAIAEAIAKDIVSKLRDELSTLGLIKASDTTATPS